MYRKIMLIVFAILLLASCAHREQPKVRQVDLDAWTGVSIEALDTHSLWTTIPMKEVKTSSGVVFRFYNNSKTFKQCSSSSVGNSYLNATTNSHASAWGYDTVYGSGNSNTNGNITTNVRNDSTCFDETIGCNNVFRIKNKVVLSYEPKGTCFTDERVQPEGEFRKTITSTQDFDQNAMKAKSNRLPSNKSKCSGFEVMIQSKGCK